MISVNSEEQACSYLNELFEAISEWMRKKKLKLNAEKTECIVFGSSAGLERIRGMNQVVLGGNVVKFTTCVRNLGIKFDSELTLKEQMKIVKKRSIGNLVNISRISKFINRDCRMKLINSLVLSNLDYCNSIYAGLPNSHLRPLQNISFERSENVIL